MTPYRSHCAPVCQVIAQGPGRTGLGDRPHPPTPSFEEQAALSETAAALLPLPEEATAPTPHPQPACVMDCLFPCAGAP